MATYNVDKFTYNSNTYNFVDNTSGYVKTSSSAASGGTTLSLVTTGEKYTWNNKSSLAIGTTSTTAAAGNHTHTTTLATDTGTSSLTLASAGKYKLTAGGSSVIFTMPTIPAATTVTQTLTTGVEIGKVNNTTLYAPAGGSGGTGSVTQTNTTSGTAYRVLFSDSQNDTTESSTIVRKNANLLFNPTEGTLTTRIDTPNASGYTMDQYGNLQCKMETPSATSCWNLKNYAGTAFFKIYWADSKIDTTGPLNILLNNGASNLNMGTSTNRYKSIMGTQSIRFYDSGVDNTAPSDSAINSMSVVSANSFYIVSANRLGTWDTMAPGMSLSKTSLSFYPTSGSTSGRAINYDKIVKLDNIGTSQINNTTTSLSSGTTKTLATVTLPSTGKWLCFILVRFEAHATGRRYICISASNSGDSMSYPIGSESDTDTRGYCDSVPAVSGATTTAQIQCCIDTSLFSNRTTYYINGYQNSGTTKSAYCFYQFIKIV